MSPRKNQFSNELIDLTSLTGGHDGPPDRLDSNGPETGASVNFARDNGDGSLPALCLHELFEARVKQAPDAPALSFEGTTLSYQELNGRANQLARLLRSSGAGPEILVGLCVDRSAELVIGVLAILKAGGAYLPLDPVYPSQRLAFMLEDAQLPVVLMQRKHASVLGAHRAKIIFLDDPASPPGGPVGDPAPNLANHTGPDNLAYVIYTSGSTGRPKGVAITHHNVVRLMRSTAPWFHFDEHDVWTLFHSYAFDFSVWEIWGALLHGGKLVVVPYFTARSPRDFHTLLAAEKVTVLNQTPTAFRQLIEADGEAVPARHLALRLVIFGGEALAMSTLQPWFDRHGDEHPRLVNMYGITETTVHVTYRPVKKADLTGPSMIGVPIPDLQIHILDEHGQPVPAGSPGELYIGGAGLARGYLRRPELTAERFLFQRIGENPAARLYRTGDLARWLPHGDLEYLGRIDSQIKIRGHRIELGEIEAVLRGHPQVQDCVAVVHDRRAGGPELRAHIVCRGTTKPAVETLRQWLREKLPEYMIPGRFAVIPAVPLTPNGKVDRQALIAADAAGGELPATVAFAAPRNNLEQTLVDIWQDVLQREQVGIRDRFFDVGGHSLLAIVICSHIYRRLGMTVPLRWVFEHPTVEALAEQIARLTALATSTAAMEQASRRAPLPMSFGQQQMWLLHQTLPDPAAYNEGVACHFTGPVDRHRVRQALRHIMERHDVLRTALIQRGDDLVQEISAAGTVALPWQEMDRPPAAAVSPEEALAGHLTSWARQPFDLARAPLWRALWIAAGETEQVLALTFHHSIADEWSLRLFFRELEALYTVPAQGAANLPALPVQYADFSAWQRGQLRGATAEELRHFWREQLRELPPPLELPADQAPPRQPSGRGEIHHFSIPGPVAAGLRDLARREGTTLFTVALAAFQVWLGRLTGQTDIIVGTPVTSRARPEVQHLLGYFLNTLPLRSRVDPTAGFRSLLARVRSTVMDSFDHASLPFEQIVEVVAPQRPEGHLALHQVMFVLLEEGFPPLRLGQTEGQLNHLETKTSKCDLLFNIRAAGDEWQCHIEYATDLFSGDCIARLAGNLTELLRSIVKDPSQPVCRLNLLTATERQQILIDWNQTQREYPRDRRIDQLFSEQAERTPGAVAVVFGDQALTYGKLDVLSTQVAGHLRALGVGRNILVGLRVERSLEMVVALLGILKAGRVYWAVEEKLPEGRFRLLLAEARPPILLVRRNGNNDRLILADDGSAFPGKPTIACLEDLLESLAPPAVDEPSPNTAADPAYVSYTSGSTGSPKGVVVPHRGVVRLVKGTDYVSLTDQEVLLHLSPLSFDASTFELWGALLNGGRVVLMPPGPPTLSEIGETIRRHGVTTAWLTAGLFHLMVEERLDDLKPLRQLLAGGDVLSPGHVGKAARALPHCRIINGYGPTENTTFTCCHTVTEHNLGASVPIGRPIANTRVYVLDSFREPVPVGVWGELYAGGDGVASGYLHQPELTAEGFLPDPYSQQPQARLYRTGDIVRWRPDGELEFRGRMDAQVKIRGFRVELGEIESCLLRLPNIREAVVVAREGISGGKFLAAYLVFVSGGEIDSSAVKAALAQELPDYMIPQSIVPLDKIPLTSQGKVDRKGLPAGAISRKDEAVAERIDLLEWELARIWRKLFHRDDIGRQDDFFALGGHSLLATRLSAEIEKTLGCKLPVTTVFQSPTIELLARRFTDENWSVTWSSLVPLQPQGNNPPIYFIHGIAGNVFGFVELARILGPDQPSYGIQAVGLDGKCPRHTTVEEMAAHYVGEMISFQPHGPYRLVGYSLGGLIAYEVARQLQARGRRVAALVLLDCGPVGATPWTYYGLAMASYLPGRCQVHVRRWLKLPMRAKFHYFQARLKSLRNLFMANRPKPGQDTAPHPPDGVQPKVPKKIDYFHAAALAYKLRPYDGHVNFFASTQSIYGWRWYWRSLVRGGITYHNLGVGHLEILSPANLPHFKDSLAAILRSHPQANETRKPVAFPNP